MVRASFTILRDAGNGLCKTLSEILVCPLSKQPLRYCEETNSLISDAIGVSFPIFAYFSNRPSSRMKGFAITTILFSKVCIRER
ncbi:uncharacterized protein LOC122314959 isoform X2 [Carya illinoinensis]|uniref:uncharacterized protein LOC122314959 isoform X2 n=1 Tax=Carya illinoinensis TaxID=32201 RepID=UPI001C725925|nr:uncharacterized protein LOC122314959 isoform X2 [Carya illinoinensis]